MINCSPENFYKEVIFLFNSSFEKIASEITRAQRLPFLLSAVWRMYKGNFLKEYLKESYCAFHKHANFEVQKLTDECFFAAVNHLNGPLGNKTLL